MSAGEPRPALLAAVVAALDVVSDHVVVLDPRGRVVHVNVAWQRFSLDNGGDATDWIGVDYVAHSATPCDEPSATDPISDGLRGVLEGRASRFQYDYDCHAPDELRWFRLLAVKMELPGIGAIVTHTDITPQRLAERALEHHATHDAATGLRNRASLEHQMRQLVFERRTVGAIRVELAEPGSSAELVPDADVAQVAMILRELFPAPAILGRWGSARLLVVLAGATDAHLDESADVLSSTLDAMNPDLTAHVRWHRVRDERDFVALDTSADLAPRGRGGTAA
ncbi:PAS domain-containing protein [Patulibacter sp.]|uniref:PAS domain-containing protein n=1 Tax=Patulibacter sp. TaxID=1912859 RepID=UPI002717FC79|nr:PAS domain-containing protein [Patulibacter sp.]MDO9409370.1 PAS domain-containing protein [Patulibacter sp.]